MSEHPNTQIARRAWEAISQGDAESLLTLLDPAVVWHATARGTPWSGTHRGAESVVDYLARVGEASEFFEMFLRQELGGAALERRAHKDGAFLGRAEINDFFHASNLLRVA